MFIFVSLRETVGGGGGGVAASNEAFSVFDR